MVLVDSLAWVQVYPILAKKHTQNLLYCFLLSCRFVMINHALHWPLPGGIPVSASRPARKTPAITGEIGGCNSGVISNNHNIQTRQFIVLRNSLGPCRRACQVTARADTSRGCRSIICWGHTDAGSRVWLFSNLPAHAFRIIRTSSQQRRIGYVILGETTEEAM